jgi:diguanylate cyclase (GGDEF)-like protein/PAS domain S-box-containing protein
MRQVKNIDYVSISGWTEHFERLPDAWLALSRDGLVQQFNAAAPPLLAIEPSRLKGQKLSRLFKRADILSGWASGSFKGVLFTLLSPERAGMMVAIEEIPCPVPGWSGRLLRLTDVTETLEAESNRNRKLNRLTALADIMTLAENDRQHWLDQAMELGARALGLELGMVFRVDEGVCCLLAHNAPGLLVHGQTFPLADTFCHITHQTSDVVAFPSYSESEFVGHPGYETFGFQSYIGAPLSVHGALYGTLCFSSKATAQSHFDHIDKIFVKLLARWVGGLLERMNVESRLRESHGELEEQVELLAMAEKVARLGHWRLDTHSRTVLLSDEAHGFLGLPTRPEWGLGEFEALIDSSDREAWREQLNLCLSSGVPIGLELRMTSADGASRWLSLRGMRLEQHQAHQLFGVMLDITDSKQAQETILFQASHDSLTGLINRVLLFDRLGQEIRRSQRMDTRFAVLFIDLDYFKVINDRYGHEAGDRVLVQVGKRLAAALRKSDTVGRFGGDEFIAIISGVENLEQIDVLTKKILRKLEAPILFGKEELFISASIGVAMYPGDAVSPQDLIRKADNDMYQVKEQRRHLASPQERRGKS